MQCERGVYLVRTTVHNVHMKQRVTVTLDARVVAAIKAMAAYRTSTVSAQIARLVIADFEREHGRNSWGEAAFLAPVVPIRSTKVER
jgi:hypothetical protein